MKKEQQKDTKDIEVHKAQVVSVLDNLKTSNLPEIIGWKEKQKKLVEENPYLEITDNITYDDACKRRTALLKGRTELQNQDKNIASKLATFRKEVGSETAVLIAITQPHEEKQDAEVKRWEGIKAAQKKEKEEAEAKREKVIQDKLESIETESYKIIQSMVFSEIESKTTEVNSICSPGFDFEEYDVMYDQIVSRVETVLESKVQNLTEQENQRLDNLRLEEENKAAKAKEELQSKRLTELLPYNAYGDTVDMVTLWSLTEENYQSILKSKNDLHQEKADSDAKAEEERLAKEKEETETVLIIRRNRLNEIGFNFAAFQGFNHRVFPNVKVNSEKVYEASTVEFESILVEAKESIELEQKKLDVRAERERLYAEAGMPLEEGFTVLSFPTGKNENFTIEAYQIFDATDEQFQNSLQIAKDAFFKYRSSFIEMFGYKLNEETKMFEMKGFLPYSSEMVLLPTTDFDYWLSTVKAQVDDVNKKLAIEDAAKLKAENKARIKKYAKDKKILTEFVESLDFRNAVPELENQDLDVVVSEFMEVVSKWKAESVELISKY